MSLTDIPVQCTRCRHQCMESDWHDKPVKALGSISMTEKICPKCKCKSYYDIRPQVAWCWASGLIEIGDTPPADKADGTGAIVIADGPKSSLQVTLSVKARHGQGASKGKLLVPGVPEAENQQAAGDALSAWLKWCAKSNGKKHSNGVMFKREF